LYIGLLPGGGLAAAAVVRQLGLAFGEGDRLRTLAPVREHVAAAHPPEAADLDRAIGHYAGLAATTGNRVGSSGGAEAAARLQADTGNIAAMLEQAAAEGRIQELTDAVDGLAQYWRFTGFTQPALAVLAGQAIEAHGTPLQQARTCTVLGDLAHDRSDHDGARARYEEALPLYRAIPEPYSIRWTMVRLARLEPAGSERTRYWQGACQEWTSIGREDLIESIKAEFE